ncbi:MAG TPA: DUF1501 domain-containing protein [Vicinamibacterales bacterium]|nr:DUF1501 domain-containing protein [Vicinamibacterales bacterium]
MTTTRRDFLREIGCGALTATAILTGARDLMVMNALAAAAAPADYKALVCIFLFGGNDANNTVIPVDGYADYAATRGALAVPKEQLLSVSVPSAGATFGLHPNLTRLQSLWQAHRVAVVTNVGPLVAPLTRQQYLDNTGPKPYQLFSHSDQQTEWQSGYATRPVPTGWGGRTADVVEVSSNGFPTIASLAGLTLFSLGSRTSPVTVPPAPTPLPQALTLQRPGDMATSSSFRQLVSLGADPASPLLVQEAADVTVRLLADSQVLNADPSIATPFPNTSLGNQLKQAAKLMALRDALGLKRQIFFCSLGGFDTHTSQGVTGGTQPDLLTQVSDAMGAFYDATVELGIASQVTTFTMSDFSRTLKPAGSGGAVGSDHAWGSHHFVMGGAVAGGDFYGTFPTLALNGPNDADSGSGARGRWIPTTAVDQYAATFALWFGVSPTDLPTVLPNIGRFATNNLNFLS